MSVNFDWILKIEGQQVSAGLQAIDLTKQWVESKLTLMIAMRSSFG